VAINVDRHKDKFFHDEQYLSGVVVAKLQEK
jgi:hypothetical protein